MRKKRKSFVISLQKPIFADAITGIVRRDFLQAILHDRLTSFDLAKSGKFNIRCQNEFSRASLVPSIEGTDCFTMFVDTRYFPEPCQANVGKLGGPSFLFGLRRGKSQKCEHF